MEITYRIICINLKIAIKNLNIKYITIILIYISKNMLGLYIQ